MLNQLRRMLTLISSFTTGTILAVICFIALQISENQLEVKNHLAFENHLNTISYQLQHNQMIKNSWLAQLEVSNDLIICIKDNGTPFFFKGSWQTTTPRDVLIQKAEESAETLHHFDPSHQPSSMITIPKVFFKIKGDYGDTYRVALAIVPSEKSVYPLTLLQDMSSERSSIVYTRFLFISISLLGILLLAGFSYWFSGRAIHPVELAQIKQKEFIAAASHELKAPLAVIQSNTSALRVSSTLDSSPFLVNIEKECTRVARLVDDLLLLATADANTWSINKSAVALDSLLINLLDYFLPLAHKKHQKLALDLPQDFLPPLMCDEERITQAISVLLDNAIHYIPDKGHIELRLLSTSTHAMIEVIDNGPGINATHHPRIFDRFYKVDSARHDKNHYGLGLSIAKEIVQLHQGTLSLKETPGGGCTFIIKLPY